jgi:hypothetical protein
MRFFDGFTNIHTFFFHPPVVLVPTARRPWSGSGRRIRTSGFELATYVITVAASATALMAMLAGLAATARLG